MKAVLDVSIGCRIVPVENLWTEQWRTWHSIRYPWSSDATDPRKEPPYALLVHFDPYAGPDTDKTMIIPIFHSKRELSNHNSSCSRTHDRLWHTAHKTQGITFPCAVLKIGNGDFAPGLVAISRVKS
ncbi:hypothetical protein V8E54_002043, partial [Elaphomyces granulatus]